MTEGQSSVAPRALRRILPLVKPFKRPLAAAIATSLLALGAQLCQPLVVKAVIDRGGIL